MFEKQGKIAQMVDWAPINRNVLNSNPSKGVLFFNGEKQFSP